DNMLSNPQNVFIGHTAGNEVFEGAAARLIEQAGARGYMRKMLHVFRDNNGRPMIEVFRFRRAGS
ncbi:MAG: hypothetical protein ACRD7E_07060, partial [Bryobacteraceae bacterium]